MIVRAAGIVVIAGMAVIGATTARAESQGCEKIVAASEQAGGGISADELAKKLDTDVQTVRNCLDPKAPKPSGPPPQTK
jgi:glutamate dehydrogenase/leucine dehydrogenase